MLSKKIQQRFSLALHSKWNRRYMFSLILCALIPMCIIIGFYLNRTSRELREKSLAPGEHAIADLHNVNSSLWKSISSITAALNNQPSILSYIQSDENDLLLTQDVQRILSSAIASHALIDDIFLYCNDARTVCSSRTLFSPKDTRLSPTFNGLSFAEYMEQFTTNTASVCTYQNVYYGQQNSAPYDVLLFSCKGFYKSVNPYAFRILFSVRLDSIIDAEYLQSDADGLSGVTLSDRRGHLLFLSGQDKDKLTKVLGQTLPGKEGGHTEFSTDSGTYVLFYEEDAYDLYRILLLLPYSSIVFPNNRTLFGLVCLFFGIAITMVVLMLIVHFYNYSPLQNLEDSCRGLQYSVQNAIQLPGSKSPFDTISETLQALQTQNTLFKGIIDSNQSIVENEAILSILGLGNTTADVTDRMNRCGITFPHEAFAVFYTKSDLPAEEFKRECMRHFSAKYHCYTANIGDTFFLLINLPAKELEKLPFYMNDFQNSIIEKYNRELIVGFSCTICPYTETPSLYLQAELAYEYHFLLGSVLISYSEIQEKIRRSIPQRQYDQKCQQLAQAILTGNLPDVNTHLEQLHQLILDHSNVLTCRHLCYDLVFFIVHTLNHSEDTKCELNYEELLQTRTIDSLFSHLNLLCTSALTQKEISGPRPSIEEINRNIARNYSDPLFSIGTLAEEYHMSSSAFSQYYKKKAGITISKYLTQYRLEQAIHLLLSSDLSVDQIVRSIGYFSTSSFIKKFREQYNQTPMEYRLTHKP